MLFALTAGLVHAIPMLPMNGKFTLNSFQRFPVPFVPASHPNTFGTPPYSPAGPEPESKYNLDRIANGETVGFEVTKQNLNKIIGTNTDQEDGSGYNLNTWELKPELKSVGSHALGIFMKIQERRVLFDYRKRSISRSQPAADANYIDILERLSGALKECVVRYYLKGATALPDLLHVRSSTYNFLDENRLNDSPLQSEAGFLASQMRAIADIKLGFNGNALQPREDSLDSAAIEEVLSSKSVSLEDLESLSVDPREIVKMVNARDYALQTEDSDAMWHYIQVLVARNKYAEKSK